MAPKVYYQLVTTCRAMCGGGGGGVVGSRPGVVLTK